MDRMKRIFLLPARGWNFLTGAFHWIQEDVDKSNTYWGRLWVALFWAFVTSVVFVGIAFAIWGLVAAALNIAWWGVAIVVGVVVVLGGFAALFMHQPAPEPEPELRVEDLPTPINPVVRGMMTRNGPGAERNLAPNANEPRNDQDLYDAIRYTWRTDNATTIPMRFQTAQGRTVVPDNPYRVYPTGTADFTIMDEPINPEDEDE